MIGWKFTRKLVLRGDFDKMQFTDWWENGMHHKNYYYHDLKRISFHKRLERVQSNKISNENTIILVGMIMLLAGAWGWIL